MAQKAERTPINRTKQLGKQSRNDVGLMWLRIEINPLNPSAVVIKGKNDSVHRDSFVVLSTMPEMVKKCVLGVHPVHPVRIGLKH
jgi:hypothetical protein